MRLRRKNNPTIIPEAVLIIAIEGQTAIRIPLDNLIALADSLGTLGTHSLLSSGTESHPVGHVSVGLVRI